MFRFNLQFRTILVLIIISLLKEEEENLSNMKVVGECSLKPPPKIVIPGLWQCLRLNMAKASLHSFSFIAKATHFSSSNSLCMCLIFNFFLHCLCNGLQKPHSSKTMSYSLHHTPQQFIGVMCTPEV